MAFAQPTATIATSNAAPLVRQPVTLTVTIDNSASTVDAVVKSVAGQQVSGPPGLVGNCTPGRMQAGTLGPTGTLPAGVTIAAGATATFLFPFSLLLAGAASVQAQWSGTRSDTSAPIAGGTTSGVTVTAS